MSGGLDKTMRPDGGKANCTMNDSSGRNCPGDSVKTTDVASKSQFLSVDNPKRGFMVSR
jgi:hypothetical protein